MKRTYETPAVEKIAFQYQEQVVAASGRCEVTITQSSSNTGILTCSHPSEIGKTSE